MKKHLFALLAASLALGAHAELNGDGYYRIQNNYSTRYCYLLDKHGYVDVGATMVDVSAIELFMDKEKFLSDPASVFYITKVGSKYDLQAQGCGVYSMVGEYLSISKYKDTDTYLAYGSYSGMSKTLGDNSSDLTQEHSYLTGNPTNNANTGVDMRPFKIHPMDNSANYLGVKPTVNADGGYYASWYAGFPYALSEGMTAYYVKEVNEERGLAILEPLGSNVVAEGTPVIIKCNGEAVSSNKVTVGASGGSQPSGSKLVGVYFDCTRSASHYSATANNKKTMRHIGLTSDGHLGMIAIDDEICPRNAGYLKVSSAAPAEIRLVTRDEYNDILSQTVAPTSLTLNFNEYSLTVDQWKQLTATVNPSYTTDKTVTWTSSDEAVATVDADGKVTAKTAGTATITATCQNVSDKCVFTISKREQSITWDQEFGTYTTGDVITLEAEISSTMPIVYTLDKGEGTISGDQLTVTGYGEYKVTASQPGNHKWYAANSVTKTFTVEALPSLTLDFHEYALLVDQWKQLTANVMPASMANEPVTWTSSDEAVAIVDADGKVTAKTAGTATITAACGDLSDSCLITVSKREQTITWDQEFGALYEGDVVTLEAEISSTMQIVYTLDKGNGSLSGNQLTILDDGEFQVTASQPGNHKWYPANSVTKNFNVLAGISDAKGDHAIFVDGRQIANPNGLEVHVYNILGSQVYSGTDTRISLQPGLYVVRAQGYSAKVRIR